MAVSPHAEDEALRVECRITDAGAVPVRFGYPGCMLKVVELEDRWDGDDHRYFRVRTREGGVYILRHDERTWRWQIWFFEDGWLARVLADDGATRAVRGRRAARTRRHSRAP